MYHAPTLLTLWKKCHSWILPLMKIATLSNVRSKRRLRKFTLQKIFWLEIQGSANRLFTSANAITRQEISGLLWWMEIWMDGAKRLRCYSSIKGKKTSGNNNVLHQPCQEGRECALLYANTQYGLQVALNDSERRIVNPSRAIFLKRTPSRVGGSSFVRFDPLLYSSERSFCILL